MTVFVDPLVNRGWRPGGRAAANCHMFTDELDLQALHKLARAVGLRPEWFQDARKAPHYDLTPARRAAAIAAGAREVSFRGAVDIWRRRRAEIACPQVA